MTPAFRIDESETPDGTVRLSIVGELDLATADILAERIRTFAFEKRSVLLDLDDLGFIDSTGLKVLIEAASSSRREGWDLALTQPPDVVRDAFAVFGVSDVLPFEQP